MEKIKPKQIEQGNYKIYKYKYEEEMCIER